MMVSVSHGEDRMCRACVRTLLKVGRHLRGCTVVILVMQQPNKTNPIDATPTDKPYFTPHTISTHQNVKIGNQCIS